jgi:hypothetical protein
VDLEKRTEERVDWILPLIGGLGIGSLLTTLLQTWMQRASDKRIRAFTEKREAYLGLLAALHDAAVKKSDFAAKTYALWQTKVTLVGSPAVVRYAQGIVDSNPKSFERETAFDSLLTAMRADLGIDERPLSDYPIHDAP